MVHFKMHTTESAPEASKEIMEKQTKALGFCPNLFAGLAESPQALRAYVTLDTIFAETSFTPEEQQLVLLAISTENACDYCCAAHSTMALNTTELTQAQVDAVQARRPTGDQRLDTLITFTQAVVAQRGHLKNDQIDDFLNAGYSQRAVLDIILAAAMKTLSNYSNHIMGTQVDDAFQSQLREIA